MTDASKFIAIDGPAGSGKSSVSKEVARREGYGYLDTGAAYRALAWYVLDRGDDTADADAVRAAASDFPFSQGLDPDDRVVRVGDVDVTAAIREPRVSSAVSGVARVPEIRVQVNEMFRRIVAESDYPAVIVEGRDITTVVAPDARADPAHRRAGGARRPARRRARWRERHRCRGSAAQARRIRQRRRRLPQRRGGR
jgi:cytidylate kinase